MSCLIRMYLEVVYHQIWVLVRRKYQTKKLMQTNKKYKIVTLKKKLMNKCKGSKSKQNWNKDHI